MSKNVEKGTVNSDRVDVLNCNIQLTTDDLIELAKTGETKNIELDEMGKVVFKNCLGVLDFEKDCYERYGF